jgi:hypothetical protein
MLFWRRPTDAAIQAFLADHAIAQELASGKRREEVSMAKKTLRTRAVEGVDRAGGRVVGKLPAK